MTAWLHVLLGLLAATAFVFLGRRLGRERELALYAFGLVAAALIYVGFAVFAGGEGFPLEALGLVVFSILAVLGRRLPLSLALGWALHVAWDLVLHQGGGAPSAPTPAWYPSACLGFDLLIAGYVAVVFGRGVERR